MTRNSRLFREVGDFITNARTYESMFASLFMSAFHFTGTMQEDLPADFRAGDAEIIDALYNTGTVAYDKKTGFWLPWHDAAGARDAYGRAEEVRLYSLYNGSSMTRKRDEVYLFTSAATDTTPAAIIRERAALIADFDNAIKQNLDAIKEMTLIITENEKLSKKLEAADRARRKGAAVRVVNKKMGDIGEITTLKTAAEYKVDRLQADRRKAYEDTLHICGVRTPLEKGARMINSEVATQNAETDAYVGVLFNTFNRQAEEQGAAVRVEFVPLRIDRQTEEGGGENVGEV